MHPMREQRRDSGFVEQLGVVAHEEPLERPNIVGRVLTREHGAGAGLDGAEQSKSAKRHDGRWSREMEGDERLCSQARKN